MHDGYVEGREGESFHPSAPTPLLFFLMRKIEKEMCDAVQHNSNWQSGNTSVIFQDGLSSVYLHGNLIAEIDDCSLKLFDGDHQTKTTKSRLNALLSEFGYTCGTKHEYVFQKQFEWFVYFVDTKTEQVMTVPFVNGMRLA